MPEARCESRDVCPHKIAQQALNTLESQNVGQAQEINSLITFLTEHHLMSEYMKQTYKLT
jgi:hypothetical protein